jgi:hypothetical protein
MLKNTILYNSNGETAINVNSVTLESKSHNKIDQLNYKSISCIILHDNADNKDKVEEERLEKNTDIKGNIETEYTKETYQKK